jgi:uncharacterized membrane protein
MRACYRPLLVCVFAVAFILTGCASVNDVIAAKQANSEGTTQFYDVSQDQAWEIAKTVFRWEGSDAIEEHRSEGYMTTSTGVGFLTAGTVMGAWISPDMQGGGKVKVTVITKRRVQTNLVTSLTETTFQKRFAQAVSMIKAGQPLPAAAPPMPG